MCLVNFHRTSVILTDVMVTINGNDKHCDCVADVVATANLCWQMLCQCVADIVAFKLLVKVMFIMGSFFSFFFDGSANLKNFPIAQPSKLLVRDELLFLFII